MSKQDIRERIENIFKNRKYKSLIASHDDKLETMELVKKLESYETEAVDKIEALFTSELDKARADTGLKDIDGKPIKLGDKLHKLYVNPFGELTDKLTDDYYGLGEVTFEIGSYCLRLPASPDPVPLHKLLKKKEGDYVSNYGPTTVYSDTVIAKLTQSNEEEV